MNDQPDFEMRLTNIFAEYADRAPVDVDPVSMTASVARGGSRLAWPTFTRRGSWLVVGAALVVLALGALLVAGSYLLRPHTSVGGGGLMLINQADWPGSDATRQVTLHVFSLDEANDDRRPVVDLPPSGRSYWLTSPVWSPDHTHALLTGSNGVPGIVDLATNRISLIQLAPADLSVQAGKSAWAPNGDRIATMVSNDTTNIQGSILISDLGGREVGRLEPPGLGGGEPSWSPDGSSLILPTDSVDGGTFHLLLVPLDGSPARVLLEPAAWYFSPVWSPDGSTVAFESPTGIQTLNLATGRQATIAHGDVHTPAWSPDGRRIAFAGPVPENPNGAIYVVDADGSNLHQLTSGYDDSPAWSPDGTMVVFTRHTVGSPDSGAATNGHLYSDVWVIGADGGAPRLLVTNAVADW
jgi:dipeptidyl aminopeptidase/acylaminoacyl peptidase